VRLGGGPPREGGGGGGAPELAFGKVPVPALAFGKLDFQLGVELDVVFC